MTTPSHSPETLAFFTNECLQVHALCDRALVPRVIDGSVLSMAQRVAVLEGVCRGLVDRLGKDPATVMQ